MLWGRQGGICMRGKVGGDHEHGAWWWSICMQGRVRQEACGKRREACGMRRAGPNPNPKYQVERNTK